MDRSNAEKVIDMRRLPTQSVLNESQRVGTNASLGTYQRLHDEDPSHSTQMLPDRGNEESRDIERLASTFRKQDEGGESHETSSDPIEAKVNRRWYPLLLFAIALNFFLWMSMIYAIFEAEQYKLNRRQYFITTLLIFFIPLLVGSFFILSPIPRSMAIGRAAFSERKPSPLYKNLVNILSAIFCFVVVIVYLFTSAIPAHNTATWVTDVSFATEQLPLPAFAFFIPHISGNGFYGPVNYTVDDFDIVINGTIFTPHTSDFFPPGSLYYQHIEFNDGSEFTAIVANASAFQPNVDNPLGSGIKLWFNGTYNSSNVADPSATLPQYQVSAFDPRLSANDVLRCGLAAAPVARAFARNAYLASVTQISDPQAIVKPPASYDEYCSSLYTSLLSDRTRPFSLYDLSLSASIDTVQNFAETCDVAVDSDAACRCEANLAFGSQFIVKRETTTGVSQMDIWINVGAIVGAVQFFAWFAVVAVGG